MFQNPSAQCHSSPTHALLAVLRRAAPQVLGQSGCYTERNTIFIPPGGTITFFNLFFLFLSRRQSATEQCSHGIIISASALFKRNFITATKKMCIRKGNVIYPLAIFCNILLRICDFWLHRLGMYV